VVLDHERYSPVAAGALSAAQTLVGSKFADAANESLRLSRGRRDSLVNRDRWFFTGGGALTAPIVQGGQNHR
jgi:hypothetical protein